MAGDNPSTADVVVVGGGAAGLSVAAQLAARGREVVVLEGKRIGAGASMRASGVCELWRETEAETAFLMESADVIQSLERELERSVFSRSGSVRLAETNAEAERLSASAAVAREAGLPITERTLEDLRADLPHGRFDGVVKAFHCPWDGYLDAWEVMTLYREAALRHGARFVEETRATRIWVLDGAAAGVETESGRVRAEAVVDASGPWSRFLPSTEPEGASRAVILQLQLTTTERSGVALDPLSPLIRDSRQRFYARPTRDGRLRVGLYELFLVEDGLGGLPRDFRMRIEDVGPNHPSAGPLIEAASGRFPILRDLAGLELRSGLISFPPDSHPLCGAAEGTKGLYFCSGFSGHGLLQSAGLGVMMADLITEGDTRHELAAVGMDRLRAELSDGGEPSLERRCFEGHAPFFDVG